MSRMPAYARFAEVLPNGQGQVYDGHRWTRVPAREVVAITRRAIQQEAVSWVPYDGVYPLREEGWLMAPDKPIDDLEDDAPDVPNDEVPSENDDDQEEKEKA